MKNHLYDQIEEATGKRLADDERYRQGKEESLTASQICLGGIIAICLVGGAYVALREAGSILADILS